MLDSWSLPPMCAAMCSTPKAKAEARAAYELAVERRDERSPVKFVAQAKLDALGGSTKPPAAKDDKQRTRNRDARSKSHARMATVVAAAVSAGGCSWFGWGEKKPCCRC